MATGTVNTQIQQAINYLEQAKAKPNGQAAVLIANAQGKCGVALTVATLNPQQG